MYILGKTLNGVYYYLMTNGKDRPFTRKGKRCFWTRKRSKAYQFETLEAAMLMGHDLMRHAVGVDYGKFYTGVDEMRHLYYGMTLYNWDIFKWVTGLSGAGSVSVSLFYSNLDNNNEHANTTFTGGYLSNLDKPPFIASPARADYKARKQERKRLLAEAFAEARANGVLPS